MGGFGYSLFGFLVAIAILVAVHEYGHFWVARKLGIKVLKFSIGFGRPIFRWRWKNGPTEYIIGLIPLGGFVKMLDEREGDVRADEVDQAFNRKSLAVRSAVVAAGPAFNFLFAILAIWLVFVAGTDDIDPLIGTVTEGSLAESAGFEPGDVLTEIDGKEVKTWGQHQFYLLHQAMKGNPITLRVSNTTFGEREMEIDFSALDQGNIASRPITSQIGIWPPAPPAVVNQIVADSPAEQSGLVRGDQVIAIDGVRIENWLEMATNISGKPGQPVLLSVLRGGETLELTITPEPVLIEGKSYGRIGLYQPALENTTLRFGPLDAIWPAVDYNWRMTIITLRSLGRMLTMQMSSDNLSGPITIARLAGRTIESGYDDFLKFLAIISISLGLINLLPIPVLDGGHLMNFLFEAIVGRAPSEKAMVRGQVVGLAMIVMLMVFAFYNDIARLL